VRQEKGAFSYIVPDDEKEKTRMKTPSDPSTFYDRLAGDYNSMTNFSQRMQQETELLRPLVERHGITRAADMGCGTGVHVHALRSLGVDTLGFDVSIEMIRIARNYNDDADCFVPGDFLSPELAIHKPYDAILCLGNSLPHVTTFNALTETFRYWKSCLAPDGRLLLQFLNYDSILEKRERIVAVRQEGDTTRVRFYDFTEPRITFNILTLIKSPEGTRHDLNSTMLLPLKRADVQRCARDAGFPSVAFASTLSGNDWTMQSRDTVCECS